MKILITGDKGFVGTETVKLLKKYNHEIHEIIGCDLMDGRDIRKRDLVWNFIGSEKPDRILHLAAIARFAEADKDPLLNHEINVIGTKNIVEAAKAFSIPLVYASTGSVYMPIKGTPPITEDFLATGNSQYGCSKLMGEKYVQQHTPHIILRYAHLYGREKRYHGLIGGILDRIERGNFPTLYGGAQSNDFTYVKDVAQANYLALTAPWDKWNQIYNIGTGEEISTEKAAELICKLANYQGKIERKDMRTVDPLRFVYDITKAKTMLGFEPKFTFEQGLIDMFKEETK